MIPNAVLIRFVTKVIRIKKINVDENIIFLSTDARVLIQHNGARAVN